jgi:hypothetical protein
MNNEILPLTPAEQQALEQLKTFLAPRIAQAERGEVHDGPTAIDHLLAELNGQPERRGKA